MKTRFAAALAFCALAAPVLAHHTVAGVYDPEKRATLNGVLTDVEWKQPHVLVHIDVKDEGGRFVTWVVEMQTPLIMKSHGLQQDQLKPGMTITSTVCVARDGSHRGYAQTINTPEGGTVISLGCNSQRASP